jgi:hypothetical protein
MLVIGVAEFILYVIGMFIICYMRGILLIGVIWLIQDFSAPDPERVQKTVSYFRNPIVVPLKHFLYVIVTRLLWLNEINVIGF